MVFPWVNVVGPTVTSTLARECSVDITPGHVRLLNLFGEHLDAIVSPRSATLKHTAKDPQTLTNLVDVMQTEVKQFRDSRREQELQIELLHVVKAPDAEVPAVHCKLKALPLLVIEVTRSYAARKVFVSPTWRPAGDDQTKLRGRVKRAVSDVTAACKECNHQISISGVLSMWFAQGLQTSLSKGFAATVKSPSNVSYRTGETEDRRLGTIATRQKDRSDVSSYASDKLCETASTPSRRGGSRKRTSPHCRDTDDCNNSRQSRRKWRGEHCITASSPFVPRSHGELSPDHPMELSVRSVDEGPGKISRPVTDAVLRASVNEALHTSAISNKKAFQSRFYKQEASVGSFPSPTHRKLCRGDREAAASKDSTTIVRTDGLHKDDGCDSFSAGSRNASAPTFAIAVRRDIQGNRACDAISAGDNRDVTSREAMNGWDARSGLPSNFIEGVSGAEGGEEWASDVRVDTTGCDDLETFDLLHAWPAQSGSRQGGIQSPSRTHDFEEFIRRLD